MSDALKIVLQKLEIIEDKLKQLEEKVEGKRTSGLEKGYDPLFNRAWEIILNQENDVSAMFLAKQLNIDVERAEVIMDQLAAAGFGVCYTKEV